MTWKKTGRFFLSDVLRILLTENGYNVSNCIEMRDLGCKLLFTASRPGSSIGVYAEVRRRKLNDKDQFEGASFLHGKKGHEPGNLLERIEAGCERLNIMPYIGLVAIQVKFSKVIAFLGEMETILRINEYERSDDSKCQIRFRKRETDLYKESDQVIYKEYPIDVGNDLFGRWGGYGE